MDFEQKEQITSNPAVILLITFSLFIIVLFGCFLTRLSVLRQQTNNDKRWDQNKKDNKEVEER